jgi:hypothetical protein
MDLNPAFGDGFTDFEDHQELPSDEEYEKVNRSSNAGKNSALEQDSITPVGWKPTAAKPIPNIRCVGIVRNGERKGERCGRWAIQGGSVCPKHGGVLPNVKAHAEAVVEAARLRLYGMADDALDAIDDLVTNPTTAGNVRLKAATEILDRIGIKGTPDLNVAVEVRADPAAEIAKRLASIAENLKPKDEPVDDEIVDEGEKPDA